jgi:hypothetical protein
MIMCDSMGLGVKLENKTIFKLALRKYLLTHVFYSVEEFLVHNSNTNSLLYYNTYFVFYILTHLTL